MIVIIVQTCRQRVAANDAVDDEDNEAAAVDAMGVAPKNRLIILFITTIFQMHCNCIIIIINNTNHDSTCVVVHHSMIMIITIAFELSSVSHVFLMSHTACMLLLSVMMYTALIYYSNF